MTAATIVRFRAEATGSLEPIFLSTRLLKSTVS
jgi:hypothetical protein